MLLLLVAFWSVIITSLGQITDALSDHFAVFTDTYQKQIYQMALDSGEVRAIPLSMHRNPIAIDYDSKEYRLYWTDVSAKVIKSAFLNGSEEVVFRNLSAAAVPDGLAVEPISRLLFYSDTGNNVIGVMTLTFKHHKVIHNQGLDEPRAIALDPTRGLMYWTDWGLHSRIERSSMDGTNRVKIVDTGLGNWPNGLAIDIVSGQLYWCDARANQIETSDLMGKSRTVLYSAPRAHFFGLAVTAGVIYYTDWTKKSVMTLTPAANGKMQSSTVGPAQFSRLNDIHVFRSSHGLNASHETACSTENGGCLYICIPSPEGKTCHCPDGLDVGAAASCLKSKACQSGKYGERCETCSQCSEELCESSNGHCNKSCADGWQDFPRCDQACQSGKYGKDCSKTCGQCSEKSCDRTNGHCNKSCGDGWQNFPKCDQACNNGKYGKKCSKTCTQCSEELCDRTNGHCNKSCADGWQNFPKCDKEPSNVGLITGLVIAVFLVILMAGLTFYFRRKLRALCEKKTIPNVVAECSQEIDLYENTSNMTSGMTIKLESLETVVLAQKKTPAPFLKEYESLQKGNIEAQTGSLPGNKEKNRFKNIIPYDHARVKLTMINDDPLSDYINASYINGYNKHKKFIACQAPTGETLGDFWRMIWEQNIEFIVILTELVEGAKVKCTKYWSDVGQCITIDDITTETLDQEVFQDYTIRKILFRKHHEVRTLTQFHYTAWKDLAVPDNGKTMLHFHRKVKQKVDSTNSTAPIIVHCSAGVGSTGTFIALDYLLEQAVLTRSVDIFSCVENMRAVRPSMVNTKHQYEYLYDTMVEWYTVGLTAVENIDFISLFNDERKIRIQFQFLENIRNNSKEEVKNNLGKSAEYKKETRKKNRSSKILPDFLYRVSLKLETKTYGDYINAVFVDGYKTKNEFIANQLPLPKTRGDTWRMIWDYKLDIIVCFCEGVKEIFWPVANRMIEVGPFSIETKTQSPVSEGEGITAYDIVLTYQGQDHNVVILTPYNFAMNEVGIRQLLTLHDTMRNLQRSLESEMILVQCLYGVKMCGIFIATSTLMEMMKTEREVDIFQCVKRLRTHRTEFIQTMEEYQFLYQIIHYYLHNDSLYIYI